MLAFHRQQVGTNDESVVGFETFRLMDGGECDYATVLSVGEQTLDTLYHLVNGRAVVGLNLFLRFEVLQAFLFRTQCLRLLHRSL